MLPLGLTWIGGSGAGRGSCDPCRSFCVIIRSTSSGSAARMRSPVRRLKQNARIGKRDGPVAKVGHNQPNRHHVVARRNQPGRWTLFPAYRRARRRWPHARADAFQLPGMKWPAAPGAACDRWPSPAAPQEQEQRDSPQNLHRAQLYHSRLDHPTIRPAERPVRLRMILFFYNLALFVALIAGAPWWLWRMATTHKYREGLMERLGAFRGWLASSRAGRTPAHLAPCRLRRRSSRHHATGQGA